MQQLTQEVEQQASDKAQAEQQVGELKAVEGQLELEVARLQHQLQAVEGQLQAEVGQLQGQLQSEVKRLQGQLQQARAEEEEAQEQRHALKLQLSKVSTACLYSASANVCLVMYDMLHIVELLLCQVALHSSWFLGWICCASEC